MLWRRDKLKPEEFCLIDKEHAVTELLERNWLGCYVNKGARVICQGWLTEINGERAEEKGCAAWFYSISRGAVGLLSC